MRLGLLVCVLLILIHLMDFLYFQRGLESRPCREILYIRCTRIISCFDLCLFMSIHCTNTAIETTMYCM